MSDARDTPKTIHGDADATSGGPPRKKRGRGAPPGNLNALKTSRYLAKNRARRKAVWALTEGVLTLVRQAEAAYGVKPRRFRKSKHYWPVLTDEAKREIREKAPR
jgi:hypothetical protein